jgi:hypothetical protein
MGATASPDDRSDTPEQPSLDEISAQLTEDASKFNQLKVHL